MGPGVVGIGGGDGDGVGRMHLMQRDELGETDTEIRVTAELPGLDEKDVDITVEDGVLTLRGEKRAQVADQERGYSERSYGRFERRIGLPQGLDRDKAAATFKTGVLTVTLPRRQEERAAGIEWENPRRH